MAFLAPLFLAGLAALAVPIFVHLINRERKEITEFPSLMFLERIPYRSVRRQKIRDWLLFAMRCLALILLIAAFARPFLERRFQQAAGALDSAREVVILLDRSWSMGYGDRWTRAQDAARAAIDDVGASDRATIVAFSEAPQALSQPTSDKASLRASLATVKLSARRTEYDAALKLAAKIIDESPLARREVVLISDFQKVGWDGHEEVELPPGTKLTNVDLSDANPANLSVAGVELHRSLETGRERVAVKARLTNTGAQPATAVPVVLELNDRVIEKKTLTVAPNGSGTVTFTGVPLPPGITKGRVTAGKDALPQDNNFHFVVTPDQALSVLIVEPPDPRSTHSFFLTTAVSLGDRPLMRSDVKRSSALSFGDLAGRSLVVLNDVPYPGGDMGRRLKTFVEQGGGLIVVLGQNSTAGSWVGTGADLLPGAVGQIVDRGSQRAGTLASLEYAHPVFELFSGPRSGDFSSARVYRYRPVAMTTPATVLARYDDGAPALIEKPVGKGRVLILTSTMDDFWNDLAKRPVYVPFVHQLVKYASAYADVRPWFVAGQVMELGRVAEQLNGGGGGPGSAPRATDGGEFVAESPSGETIRPSTGDDGHVIELEEQGFYDIRQAGGPRTSTQAVAVNLDMAESDLSRVDPQELAGAVAPRSGDGYRPGLGAPPTPEEQERRQTLWWYLLVGALLLLGAETVVSNRLSRAPR